VEGVEGGLVSFELSEEEKRANEHAKTLDVGFERVASNEWLNDRDDSAAGDTSGARRPTPPLGGGVQYLRDEQARVATAQSGESSSRPLSSSQGARGGALDQQVSHLEKHINYLLPKALLPEVYQSVYALTHLVPTRSHTPPLLLRPPTIPPWNPSSPQSPSRKMTYEHQMKLPLVPSATPAALNFRARTPRSPMRLSVGFQVGSLERLGARKQGDACNMGREAPFEIEALETRVCRAHSWKEPAGMPKYSMHHSSRASHLYTTNPPVGAGFKTQDSPEITQSNSSARESWEKRRVAPNQGVSVTLKMETRDMEMLNETRDMERASCSTWLSLSLPRGGLKEGLEGTLGPTGHVLPLNASTSFFLSPAMEALHCAPRVTAVAGTDSLKNRHLLAQRKACEKLQQHTEMYTYVRPSLRPAAAYRALDYEYQYESVAREAALAKARQRCVYQVALKEVTTAAAALALKGVLHIVCEGMRQRELARLQREAQERTRRAHEAFERQCVELVIVRVISATGLPVDDKSHKEAPQPYLWITTGANTKARGTRKVTLPPDKNGGGGGGGFGEPKKPGGARGGGRGGGGGG